MENATDDLFSSNQDTWSQWGIAIHEDPEQVKRQHNAASKDTTPISVSERSGIFRGSKKDYYTDLLACSCRDFALRKKPCKHMYRLAYELSVYMIDGVLTDNSICNKKRIENVMPVVFSLPEELQILYREICFSCGNDNKTSKGYMLDIDTANIFIDKGLLCPVTDKSKLFPHCHAKDIRNALNGLTDEPLPKKAKELRKFASDNFPDFDFPLPSGQLCLELPADIAHLAMSIRKRLYDKYPVEHYSFF